VANEDVMRSVIIVVVIVIVVVVTAPSPIIRMVS